VVVAHISRGDWQCDLPEGDGLLAQDHFVEWMWAIFELIPGEPQPFEGVEVHGVEATTPIHESLGVIPDFASKTMYPSYVCTRSIVPHK
jgi:hypothetical protein